MFSQATINTLDYSIIESFDILSPHHRSSKSSIWNCVNAFDIETSNIPNSDESHMYIWQWAIDEDVVVIGRTWDEFRLFIQRLNDINKKNKVHSVVYVHNLSFEFCFIASILEISDLFCVGPHNILNFRSDNIEFRCSFLLTNMSLKSFLKQYDVEHQKLDGDEFDYDEIRYPWTELSPKQLTYCINDVIGLVEGIKQLMIKRGDNLLTIPLTKTGYVRRDIKDVFKTEDDKRKEGVKGTFNYFERRSLQPDLKLYRILHDSFRGGDTHASILWSSRIAWNVICEDRSSSYPDVMVNCKFPIKPFKLSLNANWDTLKTLYKHRVPFIVRIGVYNLSIKREFIPCPYISFNKITNYDNVQLDNGRVTYCDYCEMAITDVDYAIMCHEYDITDIQVEECWTSKYGYLPACFRDTIKKYYIDKTSLKGVEGSEEQYLKAKENANSCYGMAATNPIKPEMKFDESSGEFYWDDVNFNPEALITKNKTKAFLPYQIGVWTAAWARYYLRLAINACGFNFIYGDTDSVFFVDFPDGRIQKKLDELNIKLRQRSINNGAYAKDAKGNMHYLGEYEIDKECRRFSTLGAKKYIYEDTNNQLHITIAGVNKQKGADELYDLAKDKAGADADQEKIMHTAFKLFNSRDVIFREAGGTAAIYNWHEPRIIMVDGHELEITSNLKLQKSEYSLGITDDYKRLMGSDFVQFLKRQMMEEGYYD